MSYKYSKINDVVYTRILDFIEQLISETEERVAKDMEEAFTEELKGILDKLNSEAKNGTDK